MIWLHLCEVLSTVVKFVETDSRIVGLPCGLMVKTFNAGGEVLIAGKGTKIPRH